MTRRPISICINTKPRPRKILHGAYSLVTNTYWICFSHSINEWGGQSIEGNCSAAVLEAWKIPGDVVVEQSKTSKTGQKHWRPGRAKEKLFVNWTGWSPQDWAFMLNGRVFRRGIFADTGSGRDPQTYCSQAIFIALPVQTGRQSGSSCVRDVKNGSAGNPRLYAMALFFELCVPGQQSRKTTFIFHPVAPPGVLEASGGGGQPKSTQSQSCDCWGLWG